MAEVDAPTAGEGEVVLEVAATGICGSELEGVRTPNSTRVPPLVMGHEIVGCPIGTNQLVAVNPLLSCGLCDQCEAGRTNLCRHRQLVGLHRPGGFAELVAVPASRCRPLPDGLDIGFAVLAEPLANGLHAVRQAERQLDGVPRSLGVIGAGMLGIASAFAAIRAGVAEVTVADLSEERRSLAAETMDVTGTARLEGEFDAVVDAVGVGATRADAVDRLRAGGVAVWIGLQDPDPGFDSLALVREERMVCGTYAYLDAEFEEAIKLCCGADPRWVERVQLASAAERFTELMREPAATPKTIVVPNRPRPILEAVGKGIL